MIKRFFRLCVALLLVGASTIVIFIPDIVIPNPTSQGRTVVFVIGLMIIIVGVALVLPKEKKGG